VIVQMLTSKLCILMSIIYYVYLTNLTKDSTNSETVLRQIQKSTKNHSLDVAKNMWKRIPHLMQEHKTPQGKDILQWIYFHKLIKSKHPNKN